MHWIKRFIYFAGKRYPRELGATEVSEFLSYLATERNVAAAMQNQALAALLFLYSQLLELNLTRLEGMIRAKRPVRLPVVLSESEVRDRLAELEGARWLTARLLYGAGLRL